MFSCDSDMLWFIRGFTHRKALDCPETVSYCRLHGGLNELLGVGGGGEGPKSVNEKMLSSKYFVDLRETVITNRWVLIDW